MMFKISWLMKPKKKEHRMLKLQVMKILALNKDNCKFNLFQIPKIKYLTEIRIRKISKER